MVVNFEGPQKFFIKLDAKRNVEKFTNKLNNFYMQKRHQRQLEDVSINSAAVISVDNRGRSWMRCIVKKFIDQIRVEVLCVDHGKSMVVERSSLNYLKALFSQQTPFAIECQLADIEVAGNSERIRDLFDNFVYSNSKVQVKITGATEEDENVYFVHLYFLIRNYKVNFNAILAGLRLTETFSTSLMENFVTTTVNRTSLVKIESFEFSDPGNISLLLEKTQKRGDQLEKFFESFYNLAKFCL